MYAKTPASISSDDRFQPISEAGSSPYALFEALIRRWKLLVLLPICLTVGTVGIALISPRTFTAEASFVPTGGQGGETQLSSLAAQFGVTVGGSNTGGDSPSFYKTLLETHEIASTLLNSPVPLPGAGRSAAPRLIDLLVDDDVGSPEAMPRGEKRLRTLVEISIDRETGVVSLRATTAWPEASFMLAREMVRLANDFTVRKRQEGAAAEQVFIQGRLSDAASGLRRAEDDLQGFLQHNRRYEGDPQLVFAFDRLQRTVQLRQAVYTTLAQSAEQASLNANRNTPYIVSVQPPVVSSSPDSRRLALKALLATLIGMFVGLILVGCAEYLAVSRARDPDSYASFSLVRRRLSMRLLRRRSSEL